MICSNIYYNVICSMICNGSYLGYVLSLFLEVLVDFVFIINGMFVEEGIKLYVIIFYVLKMVDFVY